MAVLRKKAGKALLAIVHIQYDTGFYYLSRRWPHSRELNTVNFPLHNFEVFIVWGWCELFSRTTRHCRKLNESESMTGHNLNSGKASSSYDLPIVLFKDSSSQTSSPCRLKTLMQLRIYILGRGYHPVICQKIHGRTKSIFHFLEKYAIKMVMRLNEIKSSRTKTIPWRWINKEILSESAKQLNLDPAEIQYVFKYEKKSFFDDILSSQSSKYYKSDRRIRKTIANVIRNIASEGNVIIIGRGGEAITREIERSLHIMLEAPIKWRALRTAEKFCMTEKAATQYALGIDKKRKEFRDYFHGRATDYTRFDVTYNCMTLSVDNIAESIICLLRERKFI